MAKGRRTDFVPRASAPAGGGMNAGTMQRIQQMQEDMKRTQDELELETINVTAGGGAITITITGQQRVQSIKLDPALVDPADVPMLEDTLVAAVNEAIVAAQAHSAKRLEAVTGGVNIPGFT